MTLSKAQANLNLALWQAEADSMSSSDLYAWVVDSGLPHEVAIRLHELISVTKNVGNKVFAIGKIVIIKIIDFVKAHPFLIIGAGISAAVGTAVATLITSVPFIGQLLAPVAIALGITITAVGAVVGHRLDKSFKGAGEDIFEIAKEFFKLVTDVFKEIFCNVLTA
ncbi:MAG TPA: hypothetical protein V6D50_06905 [Chroococcales cyanobacterium]|jgi:hypothetical protein